MYFGINFDSGYVVGVTTVNDSGYICFRPLRKFLYQGDAKIFKEFVCPRLSSNSINFLVKHYSDNIKYIRSTFKM